MGNAYDYAFPMPKEVFSRKRGQLEESGVRPVSARVDPSGRRGSGSYPLLPDPVELSVYLFSRLAERVERLERELEELRRLVVESRPVYAWDR